MFGGLVNLRRVILIGNKLQYLQPYTFIWLPKLQKSSLRSKRGLQILTNCTVINSHSVSQQLAADCNISSVSVETVSKVSAMKLLDLRYNKLGTVDISILRELPKLATLYLYGNRLQCDCQLQEVWRWCEDRNILTVFWEEVPVCDTPSEVMGRWWGLLEKGQCLEGNILYYGDYKSTRYSYKSISLPITKACTDHKTDTKQHQLVSRFLKQYQVPV